MVLKKLSPIDDVPATSTSSYNVQVPARIDLDVDIDFCLFDGHVYTSLLLDREIIEGSERRFDFVDLVREAMKDEGRGLHEKGGPGDDEPGEYIYSLKWLDKTIEKLTNMRAAIQEERGLVG